MIEYSTVGIFFIHVDILSYFEIIKTLLLHVVTCIITNNRSQCTIPVPYQGSKKLLNQHIVYKVCYMHIHVGNTSTCLLTKPDENSLVLYSKYLNSNYYTNILRIRNIKQDIHIIYLYILPCSAAILTILPPLLLVFSTDKAVLIP